MLEIVLYTHIYKVDCNHLLNHVWFLFQDDFVVAHIQKERLSKYDRFFKKFEHSKALDAALDVGLLYFCVFVILCYFYLLSFVGTTKVGLG